MLYLTHLGGCISNTNNLKALNSYIDHTSTTLSGRLTLHLSKIRAIHVNDDHHISKQQYTTINIRQILLDNIKYTIEHIKTQNHKNYYFKK